LITKAMKKKPKRQGTRDQLLKAARAELAEGDGDLELARVAKRAGVSDGLTYYHFGDKAGLIKALVNDFHNAMDDCVTALPFQGETWAERERQRVRAMVEFFYRDPVALIAATRLRTEPSLVAEEAARTRRLNELGAKNIARAQRVGEIDTTYNPLLLVSMVLAGVTEGVRTALNTKPVIPLEEAQEEIWSFVSRAAGVPG
jgi:AcrR family transcriptional regulator